MVKKSLYWFRNDLRAEDNYNLLQACQAEEVMAIYCFDPRQFGQTAFGFPKTGKFRARFLYDSVKDLARIMDTLKIPLMISLEKPETVIPELVAKHQIQAIYFQKEWTEEEVRVAQNLRQAVPESILFFSNYDQFLWHPEDVPYPKWEHIPKVFTQFRKKCEKAVRVRSPLPLPEKRDSATKSTPIPDFPEFAQLGVPKHEPDPRSAFPFTGGTSAGKKRITSYFWDTKKLKVYKKTRNGLLGEDYSSKLSPWLANGSLSARMIYKELQDFETSVVKNQDTYWLFFELIWRDYFKYVSLKYGNAIFKQGGILNRKYPWQMNPEKLQLWIEGKSPSDFVNANMIELATTGWMSNRGRQNVASFWAKHWEQDWRIGASYFESLLLDYDVHSNWGNWMYNSGVGNDPRDRKFNPQLQAERYDANGAYRRRWLQSTLL